MLWWQTLATIACDNRMIAIVACSKGDEGHINLKGLS